MKMTQANDAGQLESLRFQFEAVSELIERDMVIIGAYLACGLKTSEVSEAFTTVPDHLNEARFLVSQIEKITSEAEHPNRKSHK
jgi:hypothetical protein